MIEISGSLCHRDTYIAIFTGSLVQEKGRVLLPKSKGTPLITYWIILCYCISCKNYYTGVEGQLYIRGNCISYYRSLCNLLPGPLHVAAAILAGMLEV